MRIWPYQMLNVLPTKQLVSQWRECLAISGCIFNKKLNHSIVNKIKDYSIEHFACYCNLVIKEFDKRNFTIGINTLNKLNNDINYFNLNCEIEELKNKNFINYLIKPNKKENNQLLFCDWHNERYIKQCMYKFQLKYDLNYIKKDQWLILKDKFQYLIKDFECSNLKRYEYEVIYTLPYYKSLNLIDSTYIVNSFKNIHYFIKENEKENIDLEILKFLQNYSFLLNEIININNLKFRNKEIVTTINKLIEEINTIDYFIINKYHDQRFLKQFLFDFQEKYDCKMIKEKEWELLKSKFKNNLKE